MSVVDYEDFWEQINIIHCPDIKCQGMLLSNPYLHRLRCSNCKKYFIQMNEFQEVK